METEVKSAKARNLAGLFIILVCASLDCVTAWLAWEDLNLHIADYKMPFEMSGEFRAFA